MWPAKNFMHHISTIIKTENKTKSKTLCRCALWGVYPTTGGGRFQYRHSLSFLFFLFPPLTGVGKSWLNKSSESNKHMNCSKWQYLLLSGSERRRILNTNLSVLPVFFSHKRRIMLSSYHHRCLLLRSVLAWCLASLCTKRRVSTVPKELRAHG